ncbi:hypothetical protein SEA_RIZWANA_41 [Arthrobacter phage Rizwana]|nr:hypothetical protein SEA_RIZWANA_41 [Arthrobacter phage Rizwana]
MTENPQLVDALNAVADQLYMRNLIACSHPVYIRDAADKIREHFGEKPLGSPEFDAASLTARVEGDLRQGLEEYFTEENVGGSIYADLENGLVGVDGMLELDKLARFLAKYVVPRG